MCVGPGAGMLQESVGNVRRGRAEEKSPAELHPGQQGVSSLRSCFGEALVQIAHFLSRRVFCGLAPAHRLFCVVHCRCENKNKSIVNPGASAFCTSCFKNIFIVLIYCNDGA